MIHAFIVRNLHKPHFYMDDTPWVSSLQQIEYITKYLLAVGLQQLAHNKPYMMRQ